MKNLISLISFMVYPLLCSAQPELINPIGRPAYDNDCSKYIETSTDKVTGRSITSGNNRILVTNDGGKTSLGLILLNPSNSRGMIFSVNVLGASPCVDEDDEMFILFRNGNRITLKNNTSFNCDGDFTVYFGGLFGKNKELNMLRTAEIETIRVWTMRGNVESDLDTEQRKTLLNTVNCLLKEQETNR